MKKSLIALAALAAVSAASAQSSVSISGIVDQAFYSVQQDNRAGTKQTKQSGFGEGSWAGSRIRFTGTEDMGGGMSGVFHLEQGISVSDGNGYANRNGGNGPQFMNNVDKAATQGNRQSFVGLKGGFGEIRLGRLYAASYDMWTNQGYINGEHTGTINAGGALQSRTKGISYLSPTMNGFNFYGTYGGGNTDTMDTTSTEDQINGYKKRVNSLLTTRVMYKKGPLNLGMTYETAKESCTANAAATTTALNYWGVGVKAATCTTTEESTSTFNALLAEYDFGFAKVNMIRGSKKAEAVASNAHTDTNWNQINVKVPLNAKTQLRFTTNTSKATNGTVSDWKGNFVNVNYSLSKRTIIYASTGSQKDSAATDAVTVKEKRSAIGLVHSF